MKKNTPPATVRTAPEGNITQRTSKEIRKTIVKALEGVTTPKATRRALENMDTAETAQEADFILTLLEGKGVNPNAPEITPIMRQSAEWKANEAK
jgi:ERCC4-type nuclease